MDLLQAIERLATNQPIGPAEIASLRSSLAQQQRLLDLLNRAYGLARDPHFELLTAEQGQVTGNFLMGSSEETRPNVFWNAVAGELQFRIGETVLAAMTLQGLQIFTRYLVIGGLSAVQSIPDSTETEIEWDETVFDNGGMHDPGTAPGHLVAPVKGIYRSTLTGSLAAASADQALRIYKNTGPTLVAADTRAGATGMASFSAVLLMEAGEYVYATAEQDSGGALNFSNAPGQMALELIIETE